MCQQLMSPRTPASGPPPSRFSRPAFPYVLLALGWLARGQWRLDRDPRKQIAIDLEILKSLPESQTRVELASQVDGRVRGHYKLDAPSPPSYEEPGQLNILSPHEAGLLFRASERFADSVGVTFVVLFLVLMFTKAAFKAHPHGFHQWLIAFVAFTAPLILAGVLIILLTRGLRRHVSGAN